MKIRNAADIRKLEAQPYDEAVPYRSVLGILEAAAERFRSRTAIRYLPQASPGGPVETVTYTELFTRVRQAANLFRSLGVEQEGDSVALLMPNVPETHYALWGAEIAGRACPINHMLRTEHIVELLQAAQAKILVGLAPNEDGLEIWPKVQEIKKHLPGLTVLAGDGEAPDADGFAERRAEQPGDRLIFERTLDRDAPAACFHTGGTTGAPKLAQHTHGNQVHTAWSASVMYDLSPEDVMVNGFPLFHVAGSFVYGLSAFVAGATLLLPTRLGYRDASLIEHHWPLIEEHGVTILAAVPTILATIMNRPLDGADISKVRVAYTGGTPLPSELAAAFEKKMRIPVRNIFGMTESAGIVTIAPFHGARAPGSTGLPIPFAEMKAVKLGPDGPLLDRTCGPGETGVVMLKGPHVGPGYTDPKRNEGVFTKDGWLISGDLGHIDDDGQVFLTGRSKDVIIRGAHNIDPAAIEEVVDRHPAVEMSAAIGQPDAYAGELPIVYVTLKPGQKATGEEILAFAEPKIAERPAIPKRVVITDEMPLTAIGKIYKPTLRARAIEHVFTEVLAAAGIDARVAVADSGHGLSAKVSLAKPADEGKARTALRDFAVTYEIEG